MPTAPVRGIRLHYQRRGSNGEPTMVLVHGVGANLAFWYLTVLPLLAPSLPVIAYDLRGHGRSDMPPRGYTSADMARDLCALLDHLALDRVVLVGHSFGANVALHLAVLHPQRVHALVLADGRVPAFQPWTDVGAALPAVDLPFTAAPGTGHAAQRWRRLLDTTRARQELGQVAGLTPDRIVTVQAPAMLVYGSRSHCLPSFEALRDQVRPRRTIIVPDAGHFHPVEQPALFAREIQAFAADCQ